MPALTSPSIRPAVAAARHRTLRLAPAWLLAVVAVLLSTALGASPTGAATAENEVNTGRAPLIGGFSARALGPNGEVTPQTYFDLEMDPGDTYDGEIQVTNAADSFVRLRVDSVDGLTGSTSGTVYANRTDPRTETSQWITPRKKALRLKADSARTLRFSIKVPNDATPGDHVGAVAFQRILQPQKKGEFAVRQVLRVAVAVQIRVKGPAEAQLGIGGMTLKALGGTQIPSVTIELQNTGQLLCRPTLAVTLSKGGEGLGTVSRQLDTILAGDTIQYPLPWPKPLDTGDYEVKAATTGCGKPAEREASVKLENALRGSTSAPGPDTAALDDDGGGIPWWALVLGVLAALGLGFFLARRTGRRTDDDGGAATAATVTPAPAPVEPTPAAPSGAAVVIEPEPEPAPTQTSPPAPRGEGSASSPD
ncbi:MAG: DUF916 domain-containing protein [Patulibacter minatonensis]